MRWLTDPFLLDLAQRSLIAGLLAVVTASVVGTWVIMRGLTFMGDALAHGVLPGIGIAFLLDLNLALGAIVGAAVMVAGIGLVHAKTRLTEDTGIGLLFVGMLALGVIIISRAGTAVDLTGLLFGDILGTTVGDIVLEGIIAAVVILTAAVFHRSFLVLSFNEQKAQMLGLRPGVANLVMLGLVTAAIVVSFQAVGTLLVFGLLVGPPATASIMVRRIVPMMVIAAAAGMAAVVVGLILSYHLDIAAGATISLLTVVEFFVVLSVRSARRRVGAA